jgi:putative NADPH-quinone reductase
LSKPLVILGTARHRGETRRAVEISFPNETKDLVVVTDYKISCYDYCHENVTDDFLSVVKDMLKADTIVFATPVYWYAMSAQLKIFFDRLSDLLTVAKDKGRGLAGKQVWLLASGTEVVLPDGFEVPFARTAEYFGMRYRGAAYLYTGDDMVKRRVSETALSDFGREVISSGDKSD